MLRLVSCSFLIFCSSFPGRYVIHVGSVWHSTLALLESRSFLHFVSTTKFLSGSVWQQASQVSIKQMNQVTITFLVQFRQC